jgi:hypothetical protein
LSVSRTPNVQVVDHRADVTGGFFNQQNVISGRVANSGEGESGPVTIGITITDPSNNILYTSTTSPQPSILKPGQEAPFTKYIRPDEMGGYDGQYYYELNIQSQ